MPTYSRSQMQGLCEEEKKKEAERLAEHKQQIIRQVGASIIAQALNTAKQGRVTSISYSYTRMTQNHVITIDEMIDYLKAHFPDCKVERKNTDIVIDWS